MISKVVVDGMSLALLDMNILMCFGGLVFVGYLITRLAPMLEDVHTRLVGVVIERLLYADLIRRYDGLEMLFAKMASGPIDWVLYR